MSKLFLIDIKTLREYKFLENKKEKFSTEWYLIDSFEKKIYDFNHNFICKISAKNMINILYDMVVYLNLDKRFNSMKKREYEEKIYN